MRRSRLGSPNIRVHFTPTGSSWLNLVERFFLQPTDDVIRHGSFTSVTEPVRSIEVHLSHRNLKPVPYHGRAEGPSIVEMTRRARANTANQVLLGH